MHDATHISVNTARKAAEKKWMSLKTCMYTIKYSQKSASEMFHEEGKTLNTFKTLKKTHSVFTPNVNKTFVCSQKSPQ